MENSKITYTGNNSRIYRHELFTVLIPSGSQNITFNLPDIPNLRDVHCLGISLYTDRQIPKDINGTTVVSSNELKTMFITLQTYNGVDAVNQMPVSNLVQLFSTNEQMSPINYRDFAGHKFNLPKSYIRLNQVLGAQGDRVILFSYFYRDAQKSYSGDFANRK